MDQLLEDYKTYYKVRMQRYEGDKLFQRSYTSEQALYDCICAVDSIDELMQSKAATFRALSVQNGIAFVQDQAHFKLQFYLTEKEDVKAAGQQEILGKINTASDAAQIVSVVNEIQLKNDTAVMIDNLWPVHFFTDAVNWLEKTEAIQTAIVPDHWKADMQQQESELKQSFLKMTTAFLHSIRNYTPGWVWNYEILWAHRHRKKCPLPDAVLQKRIEQHKIVCRL